MDVTFRPVAFSKSPVEDAICVSDATFRGSSWLTDYSLADTAHNAAGHEDVLHL
jgi:hypothetical protein